MVGEVRVVVGENVRANLRTLLFRRREKNRKPSRESATRLENSY
jgi:hypothetical protein